MKKLLLILFIIPIISFGQTETKIEYWDNGKALSQIHYLDEERDGSCRYYYKNGVWKYYYDNGQLETESIIKDGMEELKLYDRDGKLLPIQDGC